MSHAHSRSGRRARPNLSQHRPIVDRPAPSPARFVQVWANIGQTLASFRPRRWPTQDNWSTLAPGSGLRAIVQHFRSACPETGAAESLIFVFVEGFVAAPHRHSWEYVSRESSVMHMISALHRSAGSCRHRRTRAAASKGIRLEGGALRMPAGMLGQGLWIAGGALQANVWSVPLSVPRSHSWSSRASLTGPGPDFGPNRNSRQSKRNMPG